MSMGSKMSRSGAFHETVPMTCLFQFEYEESLKVNRVDVYQVWNAGGVSKVLTRNDPNEDWVEIYSAAEIVAEQEAKILSVTPEVFSPHKLLSYDVAVFQWITSCHKIVLV